MGIPDFHRSNIKYKSPDFFSQSLKRIKINTNIPLSFSKKYIIIELHSTSYVFIYLSALSFLAMSNLCFITHVLVPVTAK